MLRFVGRGYASMYPANRTNSVSKSPWLDSDEPLQAWNRPAREGFVALAPSTNPNGIMRHVST